VVNILCFQIIHIFFMNFATIILFFPTIFSHTHNLYPQPTAQDIQLHSLQQHKFLFQPHTYCPYVSLCFDHNLNCYKIATGIYKQEGIVCVSTLQRIIGKDGVKAYESFTWNKGEDPKDIGSVLQKLNLFCEP